MLSKKRGRNILLALLMALMAGCTTVPVPPTVNIRNCTPPDSVMTKHEDLPPLPPGKMSVLDMVKHWLSDIGSYNDLNSEHSALIDYVGKNCRDQPPSK